MRNRGKSEGRELECMGEEIEDRHCLLCVALAEMVRARPGGAWYSQLF